MRRERGITLLEVVVAIAIAGTVLSLAVPVFVSSSRTAGVQTSLGVAEASAARLVSLLRSDLRAARVVGCATSPDLPAISYRMPLTGDGTDADGAILWGPLRKIEFETVEEIDEGDRDIDLNGDGDRSDRFLRCRLREAVEGEDSRAVSGAHFVLNAAAPHGDIDGDGLADPTFTPVPGGIRIVLWSLIRADVTGLRRTQIDITMRNPQGG